MAMFVVFPWILVPPAMVSAGPEDILRAVHLLFRHQSQSTPVAARATAQNEGQQRESKSEHALAMAAAGAADTSTSVSGAGAAGRAQPRTTSSAKYAHRSELTEFMDRVSVLSRYLTCNVGLVPVSWDMNAKIVYAVFTILVFFLRDKIEL